MGTVVLAVAVVVAVIWLIYGTRAATSDRMDATFPHPQTCQMGACTGAVTHSYSAHPSGTLYICAKCAARVDHDLPSADFAAWEAES